MEQQKTETCPSCHIPQHKTDWILWISGIVVIISYGLAVLFSNTISTFPYLPEFTSAIFELLNRMWWGLLIGIIMVGFLAKIPKQFVIATLGKGGTVNGIFRASLSGVLLDLCSHGILVVGMQLYRRGASLGQVMAFLISSPWNSFSLTLILIALIGLKWTIILLLASMIIAICSGLIFDKLVTKGILPQNPNQEDFPKDFKFWKEAKKSWQKTSIDSPFIKNYMHTAWHESKMILRWIFLGLVLAGLMRAFVPPETFQTLFGPTIAGLGMTMLVATILEVCSEGSAPIAADIFNRAGAPGNAFAFLMTGVSTDYTEILSLKDTTKSWKIAWFLPLITVPQVIIIALLIQFFQNGI